MFANLHCKVPNDETIPVKKVYTTRIRNYFVKLKETQFFRRGIEQEISRTRKFSLLKQYLVLQTSFVLHPTYLLHVVRDILNWNLVGGIGIGWNRNELGDYYQLSKRDVYVWLLLCIILWDSSTHRPCLSQRVTGLATTRLVVFICLFFNKDIKLVILSMYFSLDSVLCIY